MSEARVIPIRGSRTRRSSGATPSGPAQPDPMWTGPRPVDAPEPAPEAGEATEQAPAEPPAWESALAEACGFLR